MGCWGEWIKQTNLRPKGITKTEYYRKCRMDGQKLRPFGTPDLLLKCVKQGGRGPITISPKKMNLGVSLKVRFSDPSQHWKFRIVSESGGSSFWTSDLLLKSIALAQINGMTLAQFLGYPLDDSSGCMRQYTNPSWSAFPERRCCSSRNT
jgi:hypothetical protein